MAIWNRIFSKFQKKDQLHPLLGKMVGGGKIPPRLLFLELLEDRTTPTSFASLIYQGPALVEERETHFLSTMDPKLQVQQGVVPPTAITFVDHTLLESVPQEELAQALVIIIQAGEDPLSQMSQAMKGLSGIETVRLISHGQAGALVFGDKVIDGADLRANEAVLATWSQSLTTDADILLYGCSVASTQAGRGLVDSLARMTGADVAASSDTTGTGGNLSLEYASGKITQALVASQKAWEASGVSLPSEGGYDYTTSGGNATITGYTGPGGAITLPSTLGGSPVTTIGYGAFNDKDILTSIIFPNSLTTIGIEAFRSCGSLTSITFGNSLTTISNIAFYQCTSLNSVVDPKNWTDS